MNILYLHGMASSHASETAAFLRKYLPQHRIITPDLSIKPEISFSIIDKIIEDEKIDILVGHSLGGFMAQKYRGMKKVLINPSLGTCFFRIFLGKRRYKHPRLDGIPYFEITPELCRAYRNLELHQYDHLTTSEKEITLGLFARYDLYTRLSAHRFKQRYIYRTVIPGRHYPTESTVRDYIVPAVEWLLQK